MENKTKIHIVDDDGGVRQTIAEILRLHGYTVKESGYAEDALRQSAEFCADVYLVDVMMPGMTGLAFLDKLKAKGLVYEAIIMTAYKNIADAQKAIELGACSYITKPVSIDILLEHVARATDAVRQRNADKERREQFEKQAAAAACDLATTREILEEKERFISGILNNIGEGILAVDCDWNIVFMNPKAQAILGLAFPQCGGQRLHEALGRQKYAGRLMRAIYAAHASGSILQPISMRINNEKPQHFLINASDFSGPDGNLVGKIITVIDQTEKMESERIRDFFLSAVAHELRTPIAIIKNYLEIMKKTCWQGKDYFEFVGNMHMTTDRLIQHINNIVAISALSQMQSAAEHTQVNINTLVQSQVKKQSADARQKAIRVTVQNNLAGSIVETNSGLLKMAIACILSNAIKFNKEEGDVAVTLSRIESDGNAWLAIECRDTGIGMPEKIVQGLFTGFEQGENPLTRRYEGIGIGLYLTKRIIEILNGRIEVCSTEGEGSTVTLRLPA
jgi:signal transduction histidine kinase/CheY-like chemotaxis protein